MNKKRSRFLIGKDDSGDTKIIMTGLFSISDIRAWAKHFHLIVKGTHKGRDYCWQVLRTMEDKEDVESCNLPGVGNPPINKINLF